jgi:hypothetical protein
VPSSNLHIRSTRSGELWASAAPWMANLNHLKIRSIGSTMTTPSTKKPYAWYWAGQSRTSCSYEPYHTLLLFQPIMAWHVHKSFYMSWLPTQL